jgi:formylglycine-generating enzyme required for sulfatase activity
VHELPRQKLCEIVERYGDTVIDNSRRCKALLLDLCGEHQQEINVLVTAMEEQVVADIQARRPGVPVEILTTRLIRRLVDSHAMTEDAARWAVESWALALGTSSTALGRQPTKATPRVRLLISGWQKQVPVWGWALIGLAVLALAAKLMLGSASLILAPTSGTPTEAPTENPPPAPTAAPTPKLSNEISATEPPPTTASTPKPITASLGYTWTRPADEMAMVYVPGGTFQMGSTDAEIEAAFDECERTHGSGECQRSQYGDESPKHTVTLDDFWIDQTEVSVFQFRRFVAETGYETDAEREDGSWLPTTAGEPGWVYGVNWHHPEGSDSSAQDKHPVVLVSWNDASAYCEWTGARLPTEAEWQYAARGEQGYIYPWGDTFDGVRLNFCDTNCTADHKNTHYDDGYERIAPVGSYPTGASWCGALDMVGNVWEWVADWYDDYPFEAQTNPTGPATGDAKVLLGGAWGFSQRNVRAANRIGIPPDARGDATGFRCAVSPGE